MAIIVPARVGEVINIGRAGENKATIVTFDVTDWLEEFEDNGSFRLVVQQGGEDYYPQVVIPPGIINERLPGKVQWEITSTNTAIVGAGKCELIYEIDQIIVKSIIYDILVTNALDIELQGDIPEPITNWLSEISERWNEIEEAASYANAAAESANDAEASANKIINLQVNGTTTTGNTASVTKSESGGVITLSFALPKGDKGDKGDTGATGATGATGSRGSKWYSGTNITGTSTTAKIFSGSGITDAIVDDLYFNTNTYNIYKCTVAGNASTAKWSYVGIIQGPQGEQGIQGPVGPGATISIGTVTTGAAGSTAKVTNSGTSTAATLNFTIPKGDKGDKGDTGNTGPQGIQGETGPGATIAVGTVTTGVAGTNAAVTNVGTATAATLNFTIPKGDKGDKGDTGDAAGFGTPTVVIDNTIGSTGSPGVSINASGSNTAKVFNFKFGNLKGDKGDKGDKGNTGEISIGTITTGNAGTSAIVTNSGTSTDAILNFTIPKGDKGDTGEITVGTVATGNAGSSVVVTNSGTSTDAVLNFTIPRGDKGEQGVGFAGTLTSLPTANSTNYNAYKDKVWVCNGHAYSIIESNDSYSWIDGGIAAGITANLYDWTT